MARYRNETDDDRDYYPREDRLRRENFGGYGGEDDVLTGEDVTSYIYTDRPIYRPAQSVYFKGILRQWTTNGYKLIDSKTVKVAIEDPNSAKVFEKELPLSDRGTFSGQLDVGDEAPLGSYNITASIDPGATQRVEFIASKAGVYPWYCTEFCSALHMEMTGWLMVEPK